MADEEFKALAEAHVGDVVPPDEAALLERPDPTERALAEAVDAGILSGMSDQTRGALAVTDPGMADRAADTLLKLRGQPSPAGVSSLHILGVAAVVIVVGAILSFGVVFDGDTESKGGFDASVKAQIIQVWMTLLTGAVMFYLGSSAGAKNSSAREAAREQETLRLTYQPQPGSPLEGGKLGEAR